MKISEYKEQYVLTIIKLLIERCPRIIPRYVTHSGYYSRNTFRFVIYNRLWIKSSIHYRFVKIWEFLPQKQIGRSKSTIDDGVVCARKISTAPCTQHFLSNVSNFSRLPSTSIFDVDPPLRDEKFETSVRECPRLQTQQQRGRAHFADGAAALLFSQLRFENPPSAGSNELSANAIPRVPQIFARLRGCYPGVATIPPFPSSPFHLLSLP